MKKFVPYEKMSPKQKREIDRSRRGDWGAISPVTRRVESAKAYSRSKARRWKNETDGGAFLFSLRVDKAWPQAYNHGKDNVQRMIYCD